MYIVYLWANLIHETKSHLIYASNLRSTKYITTNDLTISY